MSTEKPHYVARISENTEYEQIEPGAYNGVCVGFVVRRYPDFNNPQVMVDKLTYIYQIALDGSCTYVKSRPMKIILGDRANLFILLNSWFGVTLDQIRKKYGNDFPCESVIGKPAQLVLNTVDSKDGTRKYLNLANVLKVRKGTTVPVTPDAIPAYLTRNCEYFELADGLTVKEDTIKNDSVPQGAAAIQDVTTSNNGYVGAVDFGTVTPQPAPAPAVPPSEQAPEVDDDSDLPF